MKIGILECGHTIDEVKAVHGGFPDMFHNLLAHHGFDFTCFDVEHMVLPASVQDCDGWLLTGSKHGAYEDHAFIPPLEQFIRDAYAAKVPMVGICFGHQIIAQALGGRVEKFKDGWAVGLNSYELDGVGEVHLNAWHQDQVLTAPKGAKTIASNAFCQHAALLYEGRALTVQPHPEFNGDLINDYVKLRRGTADYPNARMDQAQARRTEPDNNDQLGAMIAAFFKESRQHADL